MQEENKLNSKAHTTEVNETGQNVMVPGVNQGNYETYRQLHSRDPSLQHEFEKLNGGFQTIDTDPGAFNINNLKKHNDGSLNLPGI